LERNPLFLTREKSVKLDEETSAWKKDAKVKREAK